MNTIKKDTNVESYLGDLTIETRRSSTDLPSVAKEYNDIDRNAFLFGWSPQAELWNGRLAMIGFLAYLHLGLSWL